MTVLLLAACYTVRVQFPPDLFAGDTGLPPVEREDFGTLDAFATEVVCERGRGLDVQAAVIGWTDEVELFIAGPKGFERHPLQRTASDPSGQWERYELSITMEGAYEEGVGSAYFCDDLALFTDSAMVLASRSREGTYRSCLWFGDYFVHEEIAVRIGYSEGCEEFYPIGL